MARFYLIPSQVIQEYHPQKTDGQCKAAVSFQTVHQFGLQDTDKSGHQEQQPINEIAGVGNQIVGFRIFATQQGIPDYSGKHQEVNPPALGQMGDAGFELITFGRDHPGKQWCKQEVVNKQIGDKP
ncbi:hypothetical protein D3C85_1128670 [compost metagenome]